MPPAARVGIVNILVARMLLSRCGSGQKQKNKNGGSQFNNYNSKRSVSNKFGRNRNRPIYRRTSSGGAGKHAEGGRGSTRQDQWTDHHRAADPEYGTGAIRDGLQHPDAVHFQFIPAP